MVNATSSSHRRSVTGQPNVDTSDAVSAAAPPPKKATGRFHNDFTYADEQITQAPRHARDKQGATGTRLETNSVDGRLNLTDALGTTQLLEVVPDEIAPCALMRGNQSICETGTSPRSTNRKPATPGGRSRRQRPPTENQQTKKHQEPLPPPPPPPPTTGRSAQDATRNSKRRDSFPVSRQQTTTTVSTSPASSPRLCSSSGPVGADELTHQRRSASQKPGPMLQFPSARADQPPRHRSASPRKTAKATGTIFGSPYKGYPFPKQTPMPQKMYTAPSTMEEVREQLGKFAYNTQGMTFNIAKGKPIRRLENMGGYICTHCESRPIQCVEGCVVGLFLLREIYHVVRFAISFESIPPKPEQGGTPRRTASGTPLSSPRQPQDKGEDAEPPAVPSTTILSSTTAVGANSDGASIAVMEQRLAELQAVFGNGDNRTPPDGLEQETVCIPLSPGACSPGSPGNGNQVVEGGLSDSSPRGGAAITTVTTPRGQPSKYHHLVLGLYDTTKKRFGSLGISRNPELMTKPCKFRSLSDLLDSFFMGYAADGHKVTRLKFGKPMNGTEGGHAKIHWDLKYVYLPSSDPEDERVVPPRGPWCAEVAAYETMVKKKVPGTPGSATGGGGGTSDTRQATTGTPRTPGSGNTTPAKSAAGIDEPVIQAAAQPVELDPPKFKGVALTLTVRKPEKGGACEGASDSPATARQETNGQSSEPARTVGQQNSASGGPHNDHLGVLCRGGEGSRDQADSNKNTAEVGGATGASRGPVPSGELGTKYSVKQQSFTRATSFTTGDKVGNKPSSSSVARYFCCFPTEDPADEALRSSPPARATTTTTTPTAPASTPKSKPARRRSLNSSDQLTPSIPPVNNYAKHTESSRRNSTSGDPPVAADSGRRPSTSSEGQQRPRQLVLAMNGWKVGRHNTSTGMPRVVAEWHTTWNLSRGSGMSIDVGAANPVEISGTSSGWASGRRPSGTNDAALQPSGGTPATDNPTNGRQLLPCLPVHHLYVDRAIDERRRVPLRTALEQLTTAAFTSTQCEPTSNAASVMGQLAPVRKMTLRCPTGTTTDPTSRIAFCVIEIQFVAPIDVLSVVAVSNSKIVEVHGVSGIVEDGTPSTDSPLGTHFVPVSSTRFSLTGLSTPPMAAIAAAASRSTPSDGAGDQPCDPAQLPTNDSDGTQKAVSGSTCCGVMCTDMRKMYRTSSSAGSSSQGTSKKSGPSKLGGPKSNKGETDCGATTNDSSLYSLLRIKFAVVCDQVGATPPPIVIRALYVLCATPP